MREISCLTSKAPYKGEKPADRAEAPSMMVESMMPPPQAAAYPAPPSPRPRQERKWLPPAPRPSQSG
jgi:hypothetical protein